MDRTVAGPGPKDSSSVAQAAEEPSVTVCLNEDNEIIDAHVILNVKKEEAFGGNTQVSAHSCIVRSPSLLGLRKIL